MGLQNKKISFIGAGQMAEAIFGGLIKKGAVIPQDIIVTDINRQRLDALEEKYFINTSLSGDDNEGIAKALEVADIVILAIKPQVAVKLIPDIAGLFNKEDIVVFSIIGGMTLDYLEHYIKVPVIRVMPNTPMMVTEGVAGIALGQDAQEFGALAQELFDNLGISVFLEEKLIDSLTSISGCGPAYAYMFIEALADGGVKMGLPRDTAVKLAAKTLIGAGRMVLETGRHPGELKDSVCSPGGGTIEGVKALEEGAFRASVINAVEAGKLRMEELGKKE